MLALHLAKYHLLFTQSENIGASLVPQNTATDNGEYRELQVSERDVAKTVPERIFSISFHPSANKLIAVAGDKWGNIGFFEPDATDEEKAVTLFTPHTRPVTVLHFDQSAPSKLFSSSYDATVRCLDVEAMKFAETWIGVSEQQQCPGYRPMI